MAREGFPEQAAKTTFRHVFAVAEFRALWLAQLLSVIGDQLARVALTVLVYDQTRSALLAAITFVVSIVPTFIGGVTLAWLADRHPRRRVMITYDLIRCALVLVMAIPGVRDTVSIEHIKRGYYSIRALNPTGIVPLGPERSPPG